MAETQTDQLPDDPRLEEALRSLYAPDKASPELRAKVQSILAAPLPGPTSTPQTSSLPIKSYLKKLAIAAAAALAVGYAWYTYKEEFGDHSPQVQVASVPAFMTEMVQTHEAGVGPQDEAVALADAAALADDASKKLGREVPAPRLPGEWKLVSAGYCTIGGQRAARYRFTSETGVVTMLSMNASIWYGAPGSTDYAFSVGSYHVAGYLKGDSLNCIVGPSCSDSDIVVRLRDSLRGS